jgi:hypothetical protein
MRAHPVVMCTAGLVVGYWVLPKVIPAVKGAKRSG